MAWPGVRLWRVCMVGVGVCVALWWCVQALCRRWCTVCMALVYGAMALGVRMVYVVYVSCGVRCVYVVYIVL